MYGLLRRLRPVAGRYIDRALWVVVLGVLAWRLGPQLLAATGMGAGEEAAPAFELTTLAGVREFAAERGVTYPIAMATAEMQRAFGGYPGLPTSCLIDRDGRVRYRVVGFYSEPALRAAVARLLAAPARPSGP